MTDFIIIAILVVIVGAAGFYVYKAKKSGKKCIGCPDSGNCSAHSHDQACSGNCSCCCGCEHEKETETK